MSETQPSTAEASEGSHSGSTPAPDFNSYVEDLDIDAAIADLLDDMPRRSVSPTTEANPGESSSMAASRNSRSYSPSYSEPSLPVTPNTPYYFHGQAPTQQDRKRKLDPSEKGQKSQRQEKKIKTQKVFETHNITSWEQIEPLIEGETATTKKRARRIISAWKSGKDPTWRIQHHAHQCGRCQGGFETRKGTRVEFGCRIFYDQADFNRYLASPETFTPTFNKFVSCAECRMVGQACTWPFGQPYRSLQLDMQTGEEMQRGGGGLGGAGGAGGMQPSGTAVLRPGQSSNGHQAVPAHQPPPQAGQSKIQDPTAFQNQQTFIKLEPVNGGTSSGSEDEKPHLNGIATPVQQEKGITTGTAKHGSLVSFKPETQVHQNNTHSVNEHKSPANQLEDIKPQLPIQPIASPALETPAVEPLTPNQSVNPPTADSPTTNALNAPTSSNGNSVFNGISMTGPLRGIGAMMGEGLRWSREKSMMWKRQQSPEANAS